MIGSVVVWLGRVKEKPSNPHSRQEHNKRRFPAQCRLRAVGRQTQEDAVSRPECYNLV